MSMTATIFARRQRSASSPATPASWPHVRAWLVAPIMAVLMYSSVARAQEVLGEPVRSLRTLGSEAEERTRLAQLLGDSTPAGFLIRSASRLLPSAPSGADFGFVSPQVRMVENSGLPFSLNEGSLWAGRGWNVEVSAGAYARYGPVRLLVDPTFVGEENRPFQVIPYPNRLERSIWANPFHPLPESIDLPFRMGSGARARFDLGQSSLTVDAGRASLGVATENVWWGPGIRNAIVLSSNAPGFPHLFAQTREPIRTSAGVFDAQWILGRLTESDFFDHDSTNNHRSLTGAVIAWTTPFDSTLTLGLSRIVMAARDESFPIGAAFDVFRSAGHANTDTSKPVPVPAFDQITSLFGRWVFPSAGFETYVEWARFEEPKSFRDLLEYPGHSEGYTLGLQWAHPVSVERTFQLQAEASYLEPDPSLRLRPVATTYTSRGVPQGFTNRGRTLGAAIGPGSSSQWLAGDVFAARWRVGTYMGRIRWDNGTLFEPIVPWFKRQDVTLFAGVRTSVSLGDVRVLVDFAHAARYNYLYQAYVLAPLRTGGIDIINNTLAVTLSTAVGRR